MRLTPIIALAFLIALVPAAQAEDAPAKPKDDSAVAAAMAKGRAYLLKAQDKSGAWGDPEIRIPGNSGYTAMAVIGLLASTPRENWRTDKPILDGLAYMASKQGENGAITENPRFTNYFTSVAVGAWALSRNATFIKNKVSGRDYIVSTQVDTEAESPSYGGFGYRPGGGGRMPADLSNTSMAAQAIKDADLPKDHEAWKRLEAYLKRVQNSSEVNQHTSKTKIGEEEVDVASGNDGGAGYYPGGSSAGYKKRADGKYEPRSYGSMSYALLKCLVFAGVPADDPRMKRVIEYISRNWTVDRNPGFEHMANAEKQGQQGWYYYITTAARALREYEKHTGKALVITDAQGRKHDWRKEVVGALLKRQAEDGTWSNKHAQRWDEGSKVLATSFALQALGWATERLP